MNRGPFLSWKGVIAALIGSVALFDVAWLIWRAFCG
jgi:hypothetical protein